MACIFTANFLEEKIVECEETFSKKAQKIGKNLRCFMQSLKKL
jgi:hypothetical protein